MRIVGNPCAIFVKRLVLQDYEIEQLLVEAKMVAPCRSQRPLLRLVDSCRLGAARNFGDAAPEMPTERLPGSAAAGALLLVVGPAARSPTPDDGHKLREPSRAPTLQPTV